MPPVRCSADAVAVVKPAIWLAAQLAGWVYGIEPATLERLAWRESRNTASAVNGSHCGAWQVSTRSSRYTCLALQNPVIGAMEAARLLRWAQKRCGNDGLTWYRTGHCGGKR